MSNPFNWAFIGTGTLAVQVAKEITASGCHRIASVYTRNPEKCEAFCSVCRKHGRNERLKAYGGMLNEFDIVASEIRQGLKESKLGPHQATLDVMELMDECRRQMGLVYPFEKENQHV